MDLMLFILCTEFIARSLCFPPVRAANFQQINAQAVDGCFWMLLGVDRELVALQW